ncbi:MAG: ABC transporter permease [Mucilaginibacter sp.]
MIINYIKIAWRNLISQKLYSLINITGLAVGLAVCMMIMLYVAHEMSYDNFHKNGSHIFKPAAQINNNRSTINMAYMSYASAALLKQSQPTVDDYMRTLKYFKPVVVSNPAKPSSKFTETKLLFADPGFFNFFTFKLLSGNAADVLKQPFAVVISKDMARKYFGSINPIGKTLTLKTDSAYTYQVTGVAENVPSNSSIDFDFVASNQGFLTMKESKFYVGMQDIGPGSFDIYLQLKHPQDTATLRRGMNLMAKKNIDFTDEYFSFTALHDVHLKSNFGDFSNLKYLKIFPLVAVLILLLALVNYMSLTTARATLRAKEVGVRKVSGASRKTIALQFYVESALFSCLAFGIGYLLCYMFKPWFLNVLQLKIDNSFLYSPVVLIALSVLLFTTILLSGTYPSVVLSSFKPVVTLKGKMSRNAGGVTVRKVFTTLQFAISVGLIICGIIIDRQLYYFRHADTGLDRNNIVMIPVSNAIGKNYTVFKHDIQSVPGINSVATSHYAMFKGYDMFWADGKTKGETIGIVQLITDKNFISTMGLQWKYAPVLNADITGRKRVIINEAAVAKLKLPVNPIGTYIKNGDQQLEVMGVLKNFTYASMANEIQPLTLAVLADTDSFFSKRGSNLFAKINAHTNLPTLLATMQSIYKKYDADTPFSYTFADDAFNAQYKAEDRLASIFSVFTYITMMLATLGLFGLAAFTIEQRAKEIGIRKVLGASLAAITTLLSKDFLKLVVLAIIIASPVAWWAMHNWLQNFAYRITIGWWVFALAGGIAVIIALITVSFQSIKAAIANPVKSLKSE